MMLSIFFYLIKILLDVYENQNQVSYECLIECNYIFIKDIDKYFNETLVRHYKTLQNINAVSYYFSVIYSSVLLSCDKIVCKMIRDIAL